MADERTPRYNQPPIDHSGRQRPELCDNGSYQKGDERILGDSDFVEQVLSPSRKFERKYELKVKGIDLARVRDEVAKVILWMSPSFPFNKKGQRIPARAAIR